MGDPVSWAARLLVAAMLLCVAVGGYLAGAVVLLVLVRGGLYT